MLHADGSVFVFIADSVTVSFRVHSAPLQKCQRAMEHTWYWADGLHGFKKIQTANINRK
jgi:hypothetical protein